MADYPVLEVFSYRLRKRTRGIYPAYEMIAFALPDDGYSGVAPLIILRKWSDDKVEIITPEEAYPETRLAYRRIEAACGSDAFLIYIDEDSYPKSDK